jgi:ABC-type branched-subunit amino acid transport system permease subunit
MTTAGLLSYLVFFLTFAGIYALLAQGLNVQWGFAGMLNVGVAAFFAVGAYASAILTTGPSSGHLGGFGLPWPLGFLGAMVIAGLLGLAIGLVTLNLRSDYLAIASIGIAEIVRLILKNEAWLTGGVRGIAGFPGPWTVSCRGRTRSCSWGWSCFSSPSSIGGWSASTEHPGAACSGGSGTTRRRPGRWARTASPSGSRPSSWAAR